MFRIRLHDRPRTHPDGAESRRGANPNTGFGRNAHPGTSSHSSSCRAAGELIGGEAYGELTSDAMMSVQYSGYFEYCAKRKSDSSLQCEVPATTCQSKNHHLTIQPR